MKLRGRKLKQLGFPLPGLDPHRLLRVERQWSACASAPTVEDKPTCGLDPDRLFTLAPKTIEHFQSVVFKP